MSILDPRARDMIHTFTKLLQMQLAAPEQTAVVHSNLIRSVGGSSARDCRHRRPMAAAEWRGNGFTDARANGASPFKLGGVLLSKFGCLLTSVYMFNVSHRGVTLSTHVCQSVSLSTRPPLDLRFWWSELGVMWSSYLLSLNNVHTTHSSQCLQHKSNRVRTTEENHSNKGILKWYVTQTRCFNQTSEAGLV